MSGEALHDPSLVTGEPLALLLVEDSDDDAQLVVRQLVRAGWRVAAHRVETRAELALALGTRAWDLIVSDYKLPDLDALGVLAILRDNAVQAPCVVVSGVLGEERAADLMVAGAADVVLKGNISRLVPAIRRELQRAAERVERRRAEAALERTERSLRLAVDRIPDGIVVHEDGRIVHANSAAAALVGAASVEALIGLSLGSMFADERLEGASAAATDAGKTRDGGTSAPRLRERSLIRLDGRVVPVEVSSTATTWDGRPTMFVVLRDSSERLEQTAKTVDADRMATLGMLAAGVGHEINNPLAYVLANVEFLTDDLALLEADFAAATGGPPHAATRIAQTREILAEIGDGGRRIRDIVSDIIALSSDDGDTSATDVSVVLELSFRIAAAETRHRMRIVRELEPVPFVRGSASRLGQVFLNLLVNAAHSFDEGSDTNVVRVRVFRDGARVAVEFHDSGRGIPAQHLADIFAPFFTTNPRGQGTGLGLAICQRIVHSLDGEIQVESEEGCGTCFRVLLPASDFNAPGEASASPSRPSVLFVDDDALVRRSFARHVAPICDVVVTASAPEALALLASEQTFDVIVSDLMMPGMNGIDLYEEVGRLHPEMLPRIIFVTALCLSSRARAFFDGISNPCLQKTNDADEIRRAITDIGRYVGRRP